MLRRPLLYFSEANWARRVVTDWAFARRAAARFVPGDTLEEALEVVSKLNKTGLYVTLDHLGERVSSVDESVAAAEDYLRALDGLSASSCEATLSLKLTQLGILKDYECCLENLERIARRAADQGTFVRIDMEDSGVLEDTLRTYRDLCERGIRNVGVVLQSYLRRSMDDARALLASGTRIRLVKGAYDEPAEIAFAHKTEVDQTFDQLAALMIESVVQSDNGIDPANSRFPPVVAIATHDEARIRYAIDYAERAGMPKAALEFQMLFGIASELQRSLVGKGYPVRVYLPYGTEWYPYLTRRLAERPANLWFFLSNIFRR